MRKLDPLRLLFVAPLHLLFYLTHLRQRRPQGITFKKCAIFKPDNLGDMVLALGAIRYIAENIGEENCAIICIGNTKELINREFPKMETVVVAEGRMTSKLLLWNCVRMLKQLKKRELFRDGADLLISLRHHRSMHLDILFAAIPAKMTVGTPPSPWSDFSLEWVNSRLCFDKTASFKTDFSCKELALHSVVISCAFGKTVGPEHIIPRIKSATSSTSIGQKLILTPFAGSPIREIDAAQLKEVLHIVHELCNIDSLIVSSLADWQRAEQLVAMLRATGLSRVSATCTKTLEELIGLLSSASVVLTADSAPAHLAAGLNVSMVALVGGGHNGWFGFWSQCERQIWLDNRVPCYGCDWKCLYNEPICLTKIPAKVIADEIISRLPVSAAGTEHNHKLIEKSDA